MGEGGQQGGVGDGEEACGDGLPAEFVQVDGEGVGAAEACDAGAVAGAEGEEASVRGVDVEVGAVLLAQVGDGFERVDEAGVGGAGGGGDEDGAGGGGEGFGEAGGVEGAGGGGETGGGGQAEEPGGAGDRVVGAGSVEDGQAGSVAFAGEEQGELVGLGAAGGDEGVGVGVS